MAPSAAALRHAAQSPDASSSSSSKPRGPSNQSLIKAGAEYARNKVAEAFKKSKVVKSDAIDSIPRCAKSEIITGKVLGRGNFGIVNEIRGFSVQENLAETKRRKKGRGVGDEEVEFEDKESITVHCLRSDGNPRYAIKYLSPEVKNDPARFIQCISDMSVETNFLSALQHRNIIKMRAVASCDPFDPDYFIVLDRLCDTLQMRLLAWDKQSRRNSSMYKKMTDKKWKKANKLLEERLVVAFDLSAALEYLHGLRIVHRHLKPENIGFDCCGDVKIFDFGLAKELSPDEKFTDNTNNLLDNTGFHRYMAPEMAKGLHYDLTADVFSFAILLWEMMALQRPFAGYSCKMRHERVVLGGGRPRVDDSWPDMIVHVMKRGWSDDISMRPPMSSIGKILKEELTNLRNGNEMGREHMQRRSSSVMRKEGSLSLPMVGNDFSEEAVVCGEMA